VSETSPNWDRAADEFCQAWSSDVGRPDYARLADFYAPDPDVVIYDSLAPLAGFRGFEQMREAIYPGLATIDVQRTGPVEAKGLAEGRVVVTSYPFRLAYGFADGRRYELEARISEVWERRPGGYRIVHEHPSTVHDLEHKSGHPD
jgi:ketosteroid isomerase-like protein